MNDDNNSLAGIAGHEKGDSQAALGYSYLQSYLSRNSRRRIFPTGVFGNSVRNSTTLGCL
jgi:hypothetical protein